VLGDAGECEPSDHAKDTIVVGQQVGIFGGDSDTSTEDKHGGRWGQIGGAQQEAVGDATGGTAGGAAGCTVFKREEG
jgi:hypothetical protein